MSDSVRDNTEARSFNFNGSGGSPINAADLFEDQAKANQIPKDATQQLGNSVQAAPKDSFLSQSSDGQGQRSSDDQGQTTRDSNAQAQGTRDNAQEQGTRDNAQGQGTRIDASISSRGGNNDVREIPKEAPTSDVPNEHGRTGLAQPADRDRPADPIDLGPNPYANIPGVPWFNNPESGPVKDFGPKDHAQASTERVVPAPPIRTVPSATGETERRPMGGDIRPTGGDIRQTGGDIRPMGGDIRPRGGDIRPRGGDIRPIGGDIRPMGDDIRPMGDIRPDRGSTDRNYPGYPGMTIERTVATRRR